MDIILRPLLADDIPALARHLAVVEEVDKTGEHYSEADLAEEFANPDIELGKDIVGAFDGEDLVGYFAVYPRTGDETSMKIHVEGSVAPARRGEGIGTRLVAAMITRADQAHAEKHPERAAAINLSGLSANTEQADVLAAAGLVAERWKFVMRAQLADLDLEAELPQAPEGLRLVTYDAALDQPMREAHNQAFLDHPNFTPWTEVAWKQWVTESRNFRPSLSLLVVEEERPSHVVAYVQSNEFDAYFEATGRREAFVAKVGTRREHRGRGLAGMLLAQSLVRYREAGFDEAALDVDSENPTGALGLYLRAGFEIESRWTDYALVRQPVRP